MGLISDKDVNEAKEALDLDFPYLKENRKKEFLDAFFEAWKKAKKSESELSLQQIYDYLNYGIENDPENFGKAFGTLVRDVESKYKNPEGLLQAGYFEWIISCINLLKIKLAPHFYQMVLRRLDIWKDKIKLEELSPQEKANYGNLLFMLK